MTQAQRDAGKKCKKKAARKWWLPRKCLPILVFIHLGLGVLIDNSWLPTLNFIVIALVMIVLHWVLVEDAV